MKPVIEDVVIAVGVTITSSSTVDLVQLSPAPAFMRRPEFAKILVTYSANSLAEPAIFVVVSDNPYGAKWYFDTEVAAMKAIELATREGHAPVYYYVRMGIVR